MNITIKTEPELDIIDYVDHHFGYTQGFIKEELANKNADKKTADDEVLIKYDQQKSPMKEKVPYKKLQLTKETIQNETIYKCEEYDDELNIELQFLANNNLTKDSIYECGNCKNKFTYANLQQHISGSKCSTSSDGTLYSKPFKCDQCHRSFHSNFHLKRHSILHVGDKQYKCEYCIKAFVREGDLKYHMKIHTDCKKFKCKTCSKEFLRASNLAQHQKTHSSYKPHKCNICQKSFLRLTDCRRHLMTHSGKRPHQCHLCPKSYLRVTCLRQHLNTHTNEKLYECYVCKKVFQNSSALRLHYRNAHCNDESKKCTICKRVLLTEENLKLHMTNHVKTRFRCQECKNSFNNCLKLKKHYLLVHQNMSINSCDMCKLKFRRVEHTEAHFKLYHSDKYPHFECTVCQEQFKFSSLLIEHWNVHLHDKPYQCYICKKYFQHYKELLQHIPFDHEIIADVDEQLVTTENYVDNVTAEDQNNEIFIMKVVEIVTNNEQRHEPSAATHQFQCHICDASFLKSTSLQYHLIKDHN